jgi:hypothetical protein
MRVQNTLNPEITEQRKSKSTIHCDALALVEPLGDVHSQRFASWAILGSKERIT